MKTIMIRQVPEDLHKAFRKYCIDHETSMNKMFIRLMGEVVGKHKPRGDKPSGLALLERVRKEMQEKERPQD